MIRNNKQGQPVGAGLSIIEKCIKLVTRSPGESQEKYRLLSDLRKMMMK